MSACPSDLAGRILGFLPSLKWRATTVADVIRQLAAHMRITSPQDIKLVVGGRLFALGEAGALAVTQLAPETCAKTLVPAGVLSFVRFSDEPPGQDLGPQINLRIRWQDGRDFHVLVNMRRLLVRIMYACCRRAGVSINAVRFLYDGNRVHGAQTAEMLQMENNDMMDMLLDQCGD
jgi:small ubiquitin-related modifier